MKNNDTILILDTNQEPGSSLAVQLQSLGYTNIVCSKRLTPAMLNDQRRKKINLIIANITKNTQILSSIPKSDPNVYSGIPVLYIIDATTESMMADTGINHYLVCYEYTEAMMQRSINAAYREHQLKVQLEIQKSLLEQKAHEYNTGLEHSNDAILTLDRNGIFTYINQAFADIVLKSKSAIAGQNIWELYPDALSVQFYSTLYSSLDSCIPSTFEEYYPSVGKWFSTRIIPDKNGVCIYMTDVTEQKKLARVVNDQNKQLKDIAWIQSHKVRSPVSTILGLVYLLDTFGSTVADQDFVMNGIKEAAEELDKITREINIKTQKNEGNIPVINASRLPRKVRNNNQPAPTGMYCY